VVNEVPGVIESFAMSNTKAAMEITSASLGLESAAAILQGSWSR
jgi:hypothetical protein